ncbi:MAG TPA: serine/threonine-protein kinase [Polyangia bacterium]|jgi:hypothetical protein|nr:serine/threonine-protein kinase [Polyangia bacterium]
MATRATNRSLAVIAAVGAGAVALWAVRGESTYGFDGASWQRALEGRLRETAAALHARVATLADLPRLAAAVSTDAQTMRDLTQDELAFQPRAGEAIAIGQIPRTGEPLVLLSFPNKPEEAPAIFPLGPGTRLRAGHLLSSEAIKVIPRERAEELDGVVAASMETPLADFSKELADAGIKATLALGGDSVPLGTTVAAPEARRFELSVISSPGAGLHLILEAPVKKGDPWVWAGAAGLALLAVFLEIRARRSAVPIALPAKAPAVWAATPPLAEPAVSWPRTPPSVVVDAAARRIGRYEILEHIGTGGMAEVYLAQCTGEAGFTKKIALKVLNAALSRQPQVVEHFMDEARLSSLLNHPNIVQILDLGRADDSYYIAMENVDGADLARLIGIAHDLHRPVRVAVALAILRKICDGLHAAHTARADDGTPLDLVHRDVKSGNIFVARNGVVKIGDFGIAMAHHSSRVSKTEFGLVKGTPGYMSPEHRLGLPIDGRADLYGVGAIAYELLSGVPVNLDLTVLALKGKEGWPHLAPLSHFRDDVSPELESLIFKALAYDVADRFADCAVFEACLEGVARRYPPVAGDKGIAEWIDETLRAEPTVTRRVTGGNAAQRHT